MRGWLLLLAAEPPPPVCANGYDVVEHPKIVVGTEPRKIEIADVDLDGKRDVIVTNGAANTVSVILGNGDGSLGQRADRAVGTDALCVASADLTGDRRPDFVFAVKEGVAVFVTKCL